MFVKLCDLLVMYIFLLSSDGVGVPYLYARWKAIIEALKFAHDVEH